MMRVYTLSYSRVLSTTKLVIDLRQLVIDLRQPAAVKLVMTTTESRRNSVHGVGQSTTRSNKIILSTEKSKILQFVDSKETSVD